MKILANLYESYNNILMKYNQVIEQPKTIQDLITEAVQNALQNADWTQLRHFQYCQGKNQEGYFWKPVFQKFDLKTYNQVRQYLRDNIEIDDVVNFALLFSRKLMVLKMKKEIIDRKWSIERLVKTIEKMTNSESLYTDDDHRIKFDTCPICQHEDFAIFLNADSLPHANCFRCGFSGDIWALLNEVAGGSMADKVEEVWKLLEEKEEKQNEITTKTQKQIQENKKRIDTKEIVQILEEAKQNTNIYMQKLGFTKAELQELEIYYRSGKVLSKADDFRYRVIYVIRDKDGNIVGLQGRSIYDDEEERKRKVESDEHWKKIYWDSNAPEKVKNEKMKKLCSKVISSCGFQKSQHLYLLYKYAKNPSSYKKVVIVEGPKDAARVFCRHLPGVAVVATLGNSISQRQMELLAEVFGKNTEICLAYDSTPDGVKANILAWKKLKDCGFEKIRFVIYTQKNKRGEIWKDFGEMVAPRENKGYFNKLTREIAVMLNRVVASPALYVREMQKKLGIIFAGDKEIREVLQQEKNAKAQVIEDDVSQHFQELYRRCAEEMMRKTSNL